MILVWNDKVYRLDHTTFMSWVKTNAKLRDFDDMLRKSVESFEKTLRMYGHTDEEIDPLMNDYLMSAQFNTRLCVVVTAVMEDLRETMGKKDFEKCFRIEVDDLHEAIHLDGQGGLDLDHLIDIPCKICQAKYDSDHATHDEV